MSWRWRLAAAPVDWAREMVRLGHQPKLIAPGYVKAFIKRQKNDAADAEAIVEAALRPTMRFVAPKTEGRHDHGLARNAARVGRASMEPLG